MITSNGAPARTAQRYAKEIPGHIYDIGQAVKMRQGGNGDRLSGEVYRITGRLPSRNGLPQYRIRSERESHDRMATQEVLVPVSERPTDANAALIEKTFGFKG